MTTTLKVTTGSLFMFLMIFARWIVLPSVLLLMILLSISHTSAYAVIEQGVEGYPIPAERLPFILFFNATHDNNAISKIQLALYENKTSEKVTSVTYVIELADIKTDSTNAPIFRELFYTEDGILTILLSHSDSDRTLIENGYREDVLNAWVSNSNGSGGSNNLLTVSSPEIRENGVYRLYVEIFTIDDKQNVLKPEDVPKIELMLDTGKDFATRVTVVPEFPVVPIILAVSISSVIIVYTSLLKRRFV
jgi:hypothetical protein